MNRIEEKAIHIYYAGEGSVRNEDVEDVLKELEKHGGYFGAGISNDEITWIEKIEE